MTKKESKQLQRLLGLVASKRKEVGLNFREVGFGDDSRVDYLYVWCTNSAYKHELNAIMMAINGFGFCACYQRVDEDNDIVWELF